MYQFNQIHSHHSTAGSNSSSSDSHNNSSAYSSPYGSLSDPMVDEFLRDAGHMIPHSSHYENMDIDPSQLHPSNAIDTRQPNLHQEHLDTFIDFDAERSGRTFDAQHTTPTKNQHFDSGDWSWFDNMVAAPSSYPHQYHHRHHTSGFSTDNHHNELSHDSPGTLDSSTSSYSR